MCDAFLVLAQAPDGLSCFLVPRVLPDGTRNAFRIQRLKDKLGNRSNASSEIELDGAWARLVGEEGRGVRTIIEMVNHTRLDCVLGSAALMRAAVAQATHHAAHRAAFGSLLVDQPLMQNVLADLGVESEAATLTALRLARAYDDRGASEALRAASRRRSRSTGSASAGPATRPRRSSASAATATSRSPVCRGSTASSRSRRSGKARATSSASTCCARSRREPGVARRVPRRDRAATSALRSTTSTSRVHAGSWSVSRSRSRARFSAVTALRPSPMPSSLARWLGLRNASGRARLRVDRRAAHAGEIEESPVLRGFPWRGQCRWITTSVMRLQA